MNSLNDRHALLLSLRPKYLDAILDGRKSVELRRTKMNAKEGGGVFLYGSSPRSSVVATATLEKIDVDSPQRLWSRFGDVVGITRLELETYFSGVQLGYALHLRDVKRLDFPISIEQMRKVVGIEPPQSFRYISEGQTSLLLGDPAVLTGQT